MADMYWLCQFVDWFKDDLFSIVRSYWE
jgi:hypothetical protein